MNYIISLIIGALTSIMILFNGTLSDSYGNLASTILIHIVGLIAIFLLIIIKKDNFNFGKGLPILMYSAGFVGIGTVLLTNLSFMELGVSLTLALGLLGQTIFSLFIDHFGLFGISVNKFEPKKIAGLLLITIGIFVMTLSL